MKHNTVRALFTRATLLLSLATLASAQEVGSCSNASVAGAWGYTETGTLVLPTGAVPYASHGGYTLDSGGNLAGARTASVGGTIQTATVKGSATVNPDCTGTVTISFYDQSGNLMNTVGKALVYVDGAKALLGIVTSIALPNGMNLPAIITMEAKKLFPVQEIRLVL